jgi:thiol-disulfide isomerase/thioredoxin
MFNFVSKIEIMVDRIFNRKNISNAIFVALLLVLIFIPEAKALMMQGLMKVGLFSPDVNSVEKSHQSMRPEDLSGIQFKDASGKIVDLEHLKGKVVFLNFWATWCPPCLAEMPAVNKLYSKFKDDNDVVFILVDADSNFVKAQQYMDRKGYELPVYAAASGIPDVIFKGALPTTVVFDKKGRISYHESGAANYGSDKFIDFIKKLKASNI